MILIHCVSIRNRRTCVEWNGNDHDCYPNKCCPSKKIIQRDESQSNLGRSETKKYKTIFTIYLKWSRNCHESICTKLLQSSGIHRHEIDDISRSTSVFIIGQDKRFCIDQCHKTSTGTHTEKWRMNNMNCTIWEPLTRFQKYVESTSRMNRQNKVSTKDWRYELKLHWPGWGKWFVRQTL